MRFGRGLVLALLTVSVGAVVVPITAADAAPAYGTAWTAAAAGAHDASAAVGDLPGGRVVLAADMAGTLRALRGDGSQLWYTVVDPVAGRPSAVESSPAVGDLDGDSRSRRRRGCRCHRPQGPPQAGGVVAFNPDGTVKWRFQTRDTLNVYTGGGPDGLSDGVISTPAIGDVDGDGVDDVVFGALDHFVYALRGTDGRLVPGFPFDNDDTIFSSPALHDVNGDGRLEIFVGGDATPNPLAGLNRRGVFRVLDSANGAVSAAVAAHVRRHRVLQPRDR